MKKAVFKLIFHLLLVSLVLVLFLVFFTGKTHAALVGVVGDANENVQNYATNGIPGFNAHGTTTIFALGIKLQCIDSVNPFYDCTDPADEPNSATPFYLTISTGCKTRTDVTGSYPIQEYGNGGVILFELFEDNPGDCEITGQNFTISTVFTGQPSWTGLHYAGIWGIGSNGTFSPPSDLQGTVYVAAYDTALGPVTADYSSFSNRIPQNNAINASTSVQFSYSYFVGESDFCGTATETGIEYRVNVASTSTITFFSGAKDISDCTNGVNSEAEIFAPGAVITWRPVFRNASSTVIFSGSWLQTCVQYCSVEPFLTFGEALIPPHATDTATSSSEWAGFLQGIPTILSQKHPFAWLVQIVTIIEGELGGVDTEDLTIDLDYGEMLGSTSTAGQYLAVTPLSINFSTSTIIAGLGQTLVNSIRALAAGLLYFAFIWYWYRRVISFWDKPQIT